MQRRDDVATLIWGYCLRLYRAGQQTLSRVINSGGPNTATIASVLLCATPPPCLPLTAAQPRAMATSMKRRMGKRACSSALLQIPTTSLRALISPSSQGSLILGYGDHRDGINSLSASFVKRPPSSMSIETGSNARCNDRNQLLPAVVCSSRCL